MLLGQRINYLRTARGWSLRELGERAGGLSKGYLHNIENVDVTPSIATLEKIASAFDMTVSELIGEQGRELTTTEAALLDAFRSGDTLGAIRIIMACELAT